MHVGDPFCAIQIKVVDTDAPSVSSLTLTSFRSPAVRRFVTGTILGGESGREVFRIVARRLSAARPRNVPWNGRSPQQRATFARAVHRSARALASRWTSGCRILPEDIPRLRTGSEYAVDILYTEFLVRRQLGETPSVDEYRQRFPDLIEQLRRQISLSNALGHPASAADRASLSPLTPSASESPKSWPTLPGYEIISELGRGGMGIVYQARQLSLSRIVAIKVIATNLAAESGVLARFDRERVLLAQLAHQNLVVAYDAGQLTDVQYFVMEFVDGVSLAFLVGQRGVLPVPETCEVVRQAALGLQHIHEHGLVHRDIKPSNLLVSTSGTVKIIDLGLARFESLPSQVENITTYRQLLGSLDYIAPEQCEDSHSVDIRADIYSLGCTMYELLAGRAPFAAAGSMLMKIRAHGVESARPIRERRPDVPEQLADTMERMLAKNRDDRFSIPAEVAAALLPFTSGANPARLL